jgi:DNA helicase-2/ATP-dependent DNA helicase PcrA
MATRTYILKSAPDADASLAFKPPDLAKYKAELNDAQLDAVTSTEGAVLVVAGAGTGKTKTLTYRTAYLVEMGVKPEEILLLTFTRRAAREMLDRASMLLDNRCSHIQGGTFHSFANLMLRKFSEALPFESAFTILDQSDSEDVIELIRTNLSFHKKEKRFPKKGTLGSLISSSANKQKPIEDIVETEYPHFIHHTEDIKLLAAKYAAYKRDNALLDYDDLLTYLKKLLVENDAVRNKIAGEIRYLMVDEYQDTNIVQAALVELLCSVHHNVMAVGDDAQSIYSFRGANFRNILDFPNKFAGTKVIKLEENYRSTDKILSLTNFVINQAQEKFTKNLFTRKKEDGDLPAIVSAPDERFQSAFISQMVLELREEGVPLNKMAVLFRSSRNSFDLEIELNRRKIPFVKYGGQKFVEAAHIKDVVAHLKVLYNPKDIISWNRVLLLLEGVGPKTAQEMVQWIQSAENPYQLDMAKLSPKYVKAVKRLAAMLSGLKKRPTKIADQITEILKYYLPVLREKYYEDYPKREKDLENFSALTENYATLEELLTDLALEPIDFSAIDSKASTDDEAPLVLSTIHSAKGLEWHSVFLIDALDGIIPSGYAVNSADDLDEELRLLYVALTRAKEKLFISYPIVNFQRGYNDYLTNPSRFLKDVPEALFDKVILVEEKKRQKQLPAPAKQLPPAHDNLPF